MSAPDQSVNNIPPDVAAGLIDNGEARLLDVREDDEWQAGHSPSAKAAAALAAAGHRVSNLEGGMQAWSAAGLPVRTDDGSPGSVV